MEREIYDVIARYLRRLRYEILLFSFGVTIQGTSKKDVAPKFEAFIKYMEYKKVKNDIHKDVIKYFVQIGNNVEKH